MREAKLSSRVQVTAANPDAWSTQCKNSALFYQAELLQITLLVWWMLWEFMRVQVCGAQRLWKMGQKGIEGWWMINKTFECILAGKGSWESFLQLLCNLARCMGQILFCQYICQLFKGADRIKTINVLIVWICPKTGFVRQSLTQN